MHHMMTRRALTGLAVLGSALLAYIIILEAQGQLRAQPYATGFSAPVAFVQDPLDRTVQFVVEQAGRIRVVRERHACWRPIFSICGERFRRRRARAPRHGLRPGRQQRPVLRELHQRFRRHRRRAIPALDDPLVADPATRFDLRFNGAGGAATIAQPFSNHNGGHLAFGPDGYLYIGLGDGGSGDDPDHRAQNPQELLGKMLRIDVNVADASPDRLPGAADNPFVSGGPVAARPEIWAFGLRNPWRYSFDDPARGGTGALVIGDVGQGAFEEIDYEPRGRGGRNYGWRNREGAHDNVTSRPPAFTPLVDPIHEYGRSSGQSVTGGYVYRGRALGPAFAGRYFFADYVAGRVWSLALTIDSQGEARASDLVEHTAELGGQSQLGNISSFGVDADGELYIVSLTRGTILSVAGLTPPTPTGLRIVR